VKATRKRPAPRATVLVQDADEPMDLRAFIELYISLVLQLEGVTVAPDVPARRMGS
jgi:hypothetical protein